MKTRVWQLGKEVVHHSTGLLIQIVSQLSEDLLNTIVMSMLLTKLLVWVNFLNQAFRIRS